MVYEKTETCFVLQHPDKYEKYWTGVGIAKARSNGVRFDVQGKMYPSAEDAMIAHDIYQVAANYFKSANLPPSLDLVELQITTKEIGKPERMPNQEKNLVISNFLKIPDAQRKEFAHLYDFANYLLDHRSYDLVNQFDYLVAVQGDFDDYRTGGREEEWTAYVAMIESKLSISLGLKHNKLWHNSSDYNKRLVYCVFPVNSDDLVVVKMLCPAMRAINLRTGKLAS
jgi:hypothetical protein